MKLIFLKIFIDYNFINNLKKIKDYIYVWGDFDYLILVYYLQEFIIILNVIFFEYYKEKLKL